MVALLILALALTMMTAGIMMDAKTTRCAVIKNILVLGGILIILGFATLIVGP